MSHFKARTHQIRFPASIRLFVCLCVIWSLTPWLVSVCVCSKYYDINVCVQRAWSTCVPSSEQSESSSTFANSASAAASVVRSWHGINASMSYLCNHAKKGSSDHLQGAPPQKKKLAHFVLCALTSSNIYRFLNL